MVAAQVPEPSTMRAPRWRHTLWNALIDPSLSRRTKTLSGPRSKVWKSPAFGMLLTWQTICQLGNSTRSISRRIRSGWLYTQAGSAWRMTAEVSLSSFAADTLFIGLLRTII